MISMTSGQKTLIIDCGEQGLNKQMQIDDRIFIYALPESTLHKHDPFEKGQIQHYVESLGCKQVVVAGSMNEKLMHRLLTNESHFSPAAALKFNMRAFLRNQEKKILSETLRDRMLLELHVISQCAVLLDYYFIRERLEKSQLRIQGLVIEPEEEGVKPIFHNGIIYNNIISMN